MTKDPDGPPFKPSAADVLRFLVAPYVAILGAGCELYGHTIASPSREGLLLRALGNLLIATGLLAMARLGKRLRPGPRESVLARPHGWEWLVIVVFGAFASLDLFVAALTP